MRIQPQREGSAKLRFGPRDYYHHLLVITQYRKRPEPLEPYLASLNDQGLSDKQIAALGSVIVARWRVTRDTATSYRLDTYGLTGTGAIGIILLPLLLPLGIPDMSLFVALFALSVSLVLVGASPVIGFVKKELGVTDMHMQRSYFLRLTLEPLP